MANPTKLSWSHDGKNVDGTPFTAAEFAGFTLYIDGQPGVSVPRAWETDGTYEMPLATIPQLLGYGVHTLAMSVVAKNGNESAKTPPATYTYADERVPKAPFGLALG